MDTEQNPAATTGDGATEPAATQEAATEKAGSELVTKTEIERKWKIDLDRLANAETLGTPVEIKQGYLAIAENGSEVRLRQKGDQYFQTVKSDGGLVRAEYEAELPEAIFHEFWPATEGARVEKQRYTIELADTGLTIELDIFHGELEGLVVAEVEFPDLRSSETFVVPDWFGEEVTEDKSYKNKNLATTGLPD